MNIYPSQVPPPISAEATIKCERCGHMHGETLRELEKLRAEIKEVYAANERIAAERDRARVLASPFLRELTATAANLIDENKLLHARIVELESEKDDWPEE